MTFKPRLTAPSTTDKHWIHRDKGGYNPCILIKGDSVLPNCVGYAWGRFMEIMGTAPKLSRNNAENWWDHSDGYERGQKPRLGAVICWRKGKAHEGSDGAGHVAIVEKIAADGTITTSNSAYGGSRFYVRELKPPYSVGGKYVFQGFIYNPAVKDGGKYDMTYETGTYRITATSLRVRDKPTTEGRIVAAMKKGDTPSVIGLRISDDNGAWGYAGRDRWFCVETANGEKYAERISDLPDESQTAEQLRQEIGSLRDIMSSVRAALHDAADKLECGEAAK